MKDFGQKTGRKVVILAPLPPPVGGIASWAVRMLHTTLADGWTVEIVDEKVIGRSIHGDRDRKNWLVELKRCFKIWKEMKRALRDETAQVVHACVAGTATGMLRDLISAKIARRRKRKYIVHFRCTLPNVIKGRLQRLVFRALCNNSDLVLTLNRASEQYVREQVATRVQTVPNFVEDSVLRQETERVYAPVAKTVVYTGGVTKEKGCGELIAAARTLPQLQFRLVGNVRQEILEEEITSNVVLTGVLSPAEVEKELARADLFVFFSHFPNEGFSNSLVEAMAAGLPCIVTDWAANADMIEECGGIVLPVHDTAGLAAALQALAQDRERRSRMGRWNVEKARACYSESVVTRQYVKFYEELADCTEEKLR